LKANAETCFLNTVEIRKCGRQCVTWTLIPGALKQISFDGRTLVGCNASDDIYVATERLRTSPKWYRIDGKLKNAVVQGASIYGTNSSDGIYFGRIDGRQGNWTQLPGSLKQVDFDGSQLVGCNSGNDIYIATDSLTTVPVWANIPGKLIHTSVFSDKIFGVSGSGDLFCGRNRAWTHVPTTKKLKQVAYDGTWLLGVDNDNNIWAANSNLEIDPNFEQVEGAALKYVDIFQGEIFGVDINDKIFYTNLSTWKRCCAAYSCPC